MKRKKQVNRIQTSKTKLIIDNDCFIRFKNKNENTIKNLKNQGTNAGSNKSISRLLK